MNILIPKVAQHWEKHLSSENDWLEKRAFGM